MPYRPCDQVTIDHVDEVAVVTMNRPEAMNAFSDEMHVAMQEVWQHLTLDRSVRAIVLTGAGKGFSAGGDVPNFIRSYEDPEYRRQSMRGAARLLNEMLDCPKPMIAAVNGPAIGLGCSVAVSCDIVLMNEETFMSDPHVDIGLVAGDGGAVQWPLFMSILKAKYYLLTGDRIPAKECVDIGLANFAVPADRLMDDALALARRIAAKPPQSMMETKRAINLHLQQAALLVTPFATAAELMSFTTDDIKRTIDNFKKD